MTVTDPITLITTVGFPIAAFCLVYIDLRNQIKDLTRAVNTLAQKSG
jgi:hypothetical protein